MRVSGSTFFIYIYPSKFTLVVGLVPWAHGKVFFLVCVCVFFLRLRVLLLLCRGIQLSGEETQAQRGRLVSSGSEVISRLLADGGVFVGVRTSKSNAHGWLVRCSGCRLPTSFR